MHADVERWYELVSNRPPDRFGHIRTEKVTLFRKFIFQYAVAATERLLEDKILEKEDYGCYFDLPPDSMSGLAHCRINLPVFT